jgi:hypothetical protein
MRRRLCLFLAVPLAVSACASRAFDQHVAAGRWTEAAATFSQDSTLHGNEHALYRAAVIHASPDLGAYQPRLARELLIRLLRQHPRSVYRESAVGFIALIDEVDRVRYEAIERQQHLEAARNRLEADIARIGAEIDSARARSEAQVEANSLLRVTVDRLQAILRNRENELAALRVELDRLKAIDLRGPADPANRTTARIDRSRGR